MIRVSFFETDFGLLTNKADTNTNRYYQRKMDALSLFGRPTLFNLRMLLFDETENLQNQQQKKKKKSTIKYRRLEVTLEKYEQERFHEVRKAKRDAKDIEIYLPVNENARLIA